MVKKDREREGHCSDGERWEGRWLAVTMCSAFRPPGLISVVACGAWRAHNPRRLGPFDA